MSFGLASVQARIYGHRRRQDAASPAGWDGSNGELLARAGGILEAVVRPWELQAYFSSALNP